MALFFFWSHKTTNFGSLATIGKTEGGLVGQFRRSVADGTLVMNPSEVD